MNSSYPPPTRLHVVMRPDDIATLDRLAADDEVSRATYARKILRRHLRELAAAKASEAAA